MKRIPALIILLALVLLSCRKEADPTPNEEAVYISGRVIFSKPKTETIYITHVYGVERGIIETAFYNMPENKANEIVSVEIYGLTDISLPDSVILSYKNVLVKAEPRNPKTIYYRAMQDSFVTVPDVVIKANRHFLFKNVPNAETLIKRLQENILRRVGFEYISVRDNYMRENYDSLESVTFLEEP